MNRLKIVIQKNLYVLLSHHHKMTSDYYEHTINLGYKNHNLRVCARCFGSLIGFLVIILLDIFFISTYFTPEINLIFAILLALPAIIDWSSHKLTNRKKRSLYFDNSLRFTTGFILSIALWFAAHTGYLLYISLIIMIGVLSFVAYIKFRLLKNKKGDSFLIK